MSGRRTDDICRTMPWASIVRKLRFPARDRRHDQCFGEIEALHHLLFELGVRARVRRHDHRHETGLPSLFDEPRYLDTGQAKAVRRLLVGQPELKMQSGYPGASRSGA